MRVNRLQVTLVGHFHVYLNDQLITDFAADSARALLAYLALHRHQPQARDQLAGLLWSDQPRDKGLSNLRSALTRLRSALGDTDGPDALILVTRQTIGLNPAHTVWVDVSEFERIASAVRAHRHHQLARCPHCAKQMQRMIELYAHDFLADLHLQGDDFDMWQRDYREQLYETYQEVLHARTAFHLYRAEFTEAIQNARHQLRQHAWHEGAHYQLMQALANSGRRDAALAQYKRYCSVIQQELGAEPAAEITALYEQLRRSTLPVGTLAVGTLPAGLHTLPERAQLRGRQRELHWLVDQLVSPAVRLITLVGIGGMGKTRLAVAAAHALRGCFADGVWFIALADVTTANASASEEAIAAKVAGVLELHPANGGSQRTELLTALKSKEMLIVLDNFEQLLDARNLLLDLSERAGRLTLLVTSRRPLGLSNELVYPLQGLESPDEHRPLANGATATYASDAPEYAAAALFTDAAQRLNPDFVIADEQFHHLLEICRLVGGLPLALELAASSTRHLSLPMIAQRIAQNFARLIADSEDFPLRQRNVSAAINDAWQLLTPGEQTNFAQLTIFSGGFTLEAAHAVAGVTQSQLAELVHHLFLQFDSRQDRYQIHELLRQYGAEKLATTSLATAVQQRHAAYFCGWLGKIQFQLKGNKAQNTLKAIFLDLGNIKQAWQQAAQQQNIELLDQAMEGLNVFYLNRHRYQEGAELCRETLLDLQAATDFYALEVRAMLLVWQGRFTQILGDLDGADTQNKQALLLLDTAVQLGHAPVRSTDAVRAAVWMQRGHLVIDHAPEEAARCYEAALVLLRQLGDHWNEANMLTALAGTALFAEDWEKAESLNTEALALRAAMGSSIAIAHSWLNLGIVAVEQQRFVKAQPLLAAAQQLYTEIDEPYGLARTTGYLGIVEAHIGDPATAFALLNNAINRLEQLQVTGEKTLFLAELAQLPLGRVAPGGAATKNYQIAAD